MSKVEVKGLSKGDKFANWIARLHNRKTKTDLLDELGKIGVADTVKFIMEDKVKPRTSEETFARRTKYKNKKKKTDDKMEFMARIMGPLPRKRLL